MIIRFHFLVLFTLLSIENAFAQNSDDELLVITNFAPSVEKCTDKNTNQINLKNLLSAPETYVGQCVSTEGYYRARALFLKKRDLRRKYPASNRRSANRRLGIYGSETQLDSLQQHEGELVQIFGLISDCDDLHTENAIMVLGYCHYNGGPIIGLSPD